MRELCAPDAKSDRKATVIRTTRGAVVAQLVDPLPLARVAVLGWGFSVPHCASPPPELCALSQIKSQKEENQDVMALPQGWVSEK